MEHHIEIGLSDISHIICVYGVDFIHSLWMKLSGNGLVFDRAWNCLESLTIVILVGFDFLVVLLKQ